MSEQTGDIPGLANGQEIVGSDWTVMGPGIQRSEFESVVLDKDGTAYLVTAIVSARPLSDSVAVIAHEAAGRHESPILAIRANQTMGEQIVDSEASPVGPGEHLRTLGAQALANRCPK